MKTRLSLVSNSSSSSFILALKDPDSIRILGFTLEELGVTSISHNQEELNEWLDENCKIKDQYEQCLEALKKGKVICFGSCYDQDDNVVQRGLVGGGWADFEFDPKHEVEVIKDCDEY